MSMDTVQPKKAFLKADKKLPASSLPCSETLSKAAACSLNIYKPYPAKNLAGYMERYKRGHHCLSIRARIYKNVLVLSLAFFLLFSAFMGLVNLQTSIHDDATPTAVVPQIPIPSKVLLTNKTTTYASDETNWEGFIPDLQGNGSNENNESGNSGLGAYSMSVVYAGLIISSLFFTQILINRFTLKWTIVASISVYCCYILANLKPSWLTLIPTSLFMGFAAAPLWTAQCAYITEMGRLLAEIIGRNKSIASKNNEQGVNCKYSNKKPISIDQVSHTNKILNSIDPQWINDTESDDFDSGDEDLQDEAGQIMYKEMEIDSKDYNGASCPKDYKTNHSIEHINKIQKVNKTNKFAARDLTEKSIPHLMGIFFCFFQGGQIFGNLISSVTLQSDINKIFNFPVIPVIQNYAFNSSYNTSLPTTVPLRCGGQYCPYELHPNAQNIVINQSQRVGIGEDQQETFSSKINMLCYIYAMMCMLAAILVALFLDPISIADPSTTTRKHKSPLTTDSDPPNLYESNSAYNHDSVNNQGLKASTTFPLLAELEAQTRHGDQNEIEDLTASKSNGSNDKGRLAYLRHFNFSTISLSLVKKPKMTKTKPPVTNIRLIKRGKTYFHEFGSTFRHMKNKNQILLIPLTVYVGLEQGFIAADFTRAFVTCYFGMRFVGLVMALFGVVDAAHSIAGGSFNNIMPRYVIFAIAAIAHLTCIPVLQHYPHFGTHFPMILAMVSLWGAGDGILQPQLNGFYGAVFSKRQETAAFANYRLWEAVGFIISFSIHEKFCIHTKLYLLIFTLVIGMVGYGMVEYHMQKKRKSMRSCSNQN